MKQIEIIIDKNGEVTFDLQGWHGQGCAEVADQLVKSFGKEVTRTQKCEYYEEQTVQPHQHIHDAI